MTSENYKQGIPSHWQVGDRVRVFRKAASHENGCKSSWQPQMDLYIGQEWRINSLDTGGGFYLNNGWNFPYSCLENLDRPNLSAGQFVTLNNNCPVSPIDHAPDKKYRVSSIDGEYAQLEGCDSVKFLATFLIVVKEQFQVNDVIVHIPSGTISIVERACGFVYGFSVDGNRDTSYSIPYKEFEETSKDYKKIGTCDFRVGDWVVNSTGGYYLGLVKSFSYKNNSFTYMRHQCNEITSRFAQYSRRFDIKKDIKGLTDKELIFLAETLFNKSQG